MALLLAIAEGGFDQEAQLVRLATFRDLLAFLRYHCETQDSDEDHEAWETLQAALGREGVNRT